MFKKKIKPPLQLLIYEAAYRRFATTPSFYQELKNIQSGYQGESSLLYHLNKLPNEYFIYHDLRLPHQSYFFQTDFLILTPSYGLLIEVKNYSGSVYFDYPIHQLIRTYQDKKEAFPDPVIQAHGQRDQLRHFFSVDYPLETLVIFSNPRTIITAHDRYSLIHQVARVENISAKVDQLNQKYQRIILSKHDIHHINHELLTKHTPLKSDILLSYSLKKTDMRPGLFCVSCQNYHLIRKHGWWLCPHCAYKDKTSHIPGLIDYALLQSTRITNQQFRGLCQIDSSSTSSKLLSRLGLPSTGSTKGKTYSLTDHYGYPLLRNPAKNR